jgi:hypothetical protein
LRLSRATYKSSGERKDLSLLICPLPPFAHWI